MKVVMIWVFSAIHRVCCQDGLGLPMCFNKCPFHSSCNYNLPDVKAVFHFNRIVAKRSVFHCFKNVQAELMIWTQ